MTKKITRRILQIHGKPSIETEARSIGKEGNIFIYKILPFFDEFGCDKYWHSSKPCLKTAFEVSGVRNSFKITSSHIPPSLEYTCQ